MALIEWIPGKAVSWTGPDSVTVARVGTAGIDEQLPLTSEKLEGLRPRIVESFQGGVLVEHYTKN